jgi:predicted lipid-binding transport protein (Tim44 family)
LPSSEPFDPSILVFAALAVFVIWKLRSVLGVRVDRETPTSRRFQRPSSVETAPLPGAPPLESAALAPQSPDRWKGLAEPGSEAWAGLDAIAAADPGFSGEAFVDGARKAYEMIVNAFAKGDRDSLHNLLAKDVYDSFAREIDGREKRGEKVETALVSIDEATIASAQAEAGTNRITVRFVSQLISARRNRAGEIIDGSLDKASRIVDLWTFARSPRSRDPNWKLVATETAH